MTREPRGCPIFYVEGGPSIQQACVAPLLLSDRRGVPGRRDFRLVMDHVCTEWSVRNPGREVLLLGDELGAHAHAKVVEKCRAVFLFYVTANSSHFEQPLDAYPLGSFSARTTRMHEQGIVVFVLASTSARDSLLLAAYYAEALSVMSEAMLCSFRLRAACGPLSPPP